MDRQNLQNNTFPPCAHQLLLFHPNHQTPTPIPTSATDMADPCMLTPLSDSTSYEITTPANPPLHWPNVPVPLEPTPPVTGALS